MVSSVEIFHQVHPMTPKQNNGAKLTMSHSWPKIPKFEEGKKQIPLLCKVIMLRCKFKSSGFQLDITKHDSRTVASLQAISSNPTDG